MIMFLSTSLKVILFLIFAKVTASSFCNSTGQPQFQLSIESYRNTTGQWVAQVKFDHGAEKDDAGPWKVHINHATAKCKGKESVQMVTTVRGPPNRAGPFYELIPGLGYYKFHSEVKNWYEARQICAQEGAHLLIANSPEEAKSMSVFWARHPKITNDIRNDWAHIGIHDLNQEGKWVTIFDKPLNTTGYMKWLGNEPNGGTHEDCGDINRFNGQLADVVCTLELPFICEHEL